ncbi:MAG: hypothetical protein GF329_18845 [Candidatus Lokiarchaeota archaeon]|nr:hypothetical protein [Candidatus Lokiarchaeota archaeon]
MSNVKDQIISFIKILPDEITFEEIMYHLYVREKIFHGIKEADEGKKISNERAKEIIEKWFE